MDCFNLLVALPPGHEAITFLALDLEWHDFSWVSTIAIAAAGDRRIAAGFLVPTTQQRIQ